MTTARPSFGISTYNMRPAEMLALARAAEAIGFRDIWMGEHYVIPGRSGSKHPGLNETVRHDESAIIGETVRIDDPWFMLGAVAGATSRINIGTAIVIAPLMHPLLLARASATAYDVCGGRFRLGLGAGWLMEEFDALGVPFAERGSRLDETIEILRKAWAGGFFSHEGRHFRFDALQITPQPTPVPLVYGGNSRPAMRRVIEGADCWMNSATISLEDALRLRDEIEHGRRERGKSQPLTYYIRPPSPDPAEIERFVREGFENIIVYGPMVWPASASMDLDAKVDHLQRIAAAMGVDASHAG